MGLICTYSDRLPSALRDCRVGARLTQDTTFHEQEDVWIAQVEFSAEEGEREHRGLRGPPVEKNKQGTFSPHIANQELEKTVDHKSLKHGATG